MGATRVTPKCQDWVQGTKPQGNYLWAGVREGGWSYISGMAMQAGKLTTSLHVTEDTKAEFGLIDKLYGQFAR